MTRSVHDTPVTTFKPFKMSYTLYMRYDSIKTLFYLFSIWGLNRLVTSWWLPLYSPWTTPYSS